MLRVLKALPLAFAVSTLIFSTASCSSSGQAKLRVVHAIPDGPALDVDINTTKEFSSIQFTQVQPTPPAYTSVPSGNVAIQAYDTGTTTNGIFGGNGVSATFGNAQYTVVLAGFLNGSGANAPAAVEFTDNDTAPTTGNFNIRVINASPSASAAGSLDVYVVPSTDITNVSPTIPGLGFEQASSPYSSLAAGSYWVIVTESNSKEELIFPQSYAFTAGQIRTLVLVDNGGGGNPPQWLELNDVN